jgi:hydrogenase maturation protein HypF
MFEKRDSWLIRVNGIVQGVGFRPFVYNLADKYGLKGFVLNNTEGVTIRVEGDASEIGEFFEEVRTNPPPLAQISGATKEAVEFQGFQEFKVEKSTSSDKRTTFIPPDTGVCEECLGEFFDKGDRRFHYPFITCTHCGPRFSIIEDIPYDRATTAMKSFPLCVDCRQEYDSPPDRRFHTEPTACGVCGPRLSLYDNERTLVSDDAEAIAQKTVAFLKEGNILAIKGVGGFHLAVDATNDDAVKLLRERKRRPFKPFALMCGSIDSVERFLDVSARERQMLLAKERAIVILKEKQPLVSRIVAPGLTFLGVMLPYTPFQHLLFNIDPSLVLVMTSGNISEEPIVCGNDEAFDKLGHIADYFVNFDRDIVAQSDDSVLFAVGDEPYFIRRAKGFVPVPVMSSNTPRHILATGADLKNNFAVAKDNVIVQSQYIGDLESPLTAGVYRRTLEHFEKIFAVKPEIVVSDMHPNYFSTAIANEYEQQGLKRVRVQHHHAHIASVLEDYQLDEQVIGIAFDGTGYGTDGRVWGGEFLIADRKSFERAAHFSYFPLPGGEKAIKEVWRIGLALVHQAYGEDLFPGDPKRRLVLQMLEKNLNSPLCCSVGRLFDGMSAILGASQSISTEAEAAQKLEELALKGKNELDFETPLPAGDDLIIDSRVIVRQVVDWLQQGRDKADIAQTFHEILAAITIKTAVLLRERFQLNKVALSGGVFHNRLLLNMVLDRLAKQGFEALTPRNTPFNDGCMALGQIVIAKALTSSI